MAEIPKALSISFRCDDGCVEHNNRDFFTDNVDKNRTADNITYVKRDIRELYHELFDEALTEYNAKQTRKDRKISDYYEHIRLGKKEKLFQEVIVMFGNSDDCGVGSENWRTAIDLLDNYMKEFEKRNPNLKVFNAVGLILRSKINSCTSTRLRLIRISISFPFAITRNRAYQLACQ